MLACRKTPFISSQSRIFVRSFIGNHKGTWPLHLGTLIVLSTFACESVGDQYQTPREQSAGGSAGESNAGSGETTEAAGSSTGGNNSAGSGGSTDSAPTGTSLLNLNDGIAGWTVAYTTPASLTAPVVVAPVGADGDAGTLSAPLADAGSDAGLVLADDAGNPPAVDTTPVQPGPEFAFVAFDSVEGDPEAGSMLVNIPFDSAVPVPADDFYKVGVEVRLDPPIDLSGGRNLEIRARLNDGVYSSDAAPPQIKIYIRTGPAGEEGVYANFAFNLEAAQRSTWQTYSFPLASPAYQTDGTLNLSSVSTLGIEVASGAGTVVEPGSIHVDSFVLTN